MNAIDASARTTETETGAPPSLLTVILDTNPHAWNLIAPTLPLQKALATLLVFLNAHLAINPANRVAVLASHVERAVWLYPTPDKPTSTQNGHAGGQDGDTEMRDGDGGISSANQDDANKYRPFAALESALTTNLSALLSSTPPTSLAQTTTPQTAGALTLALTHLSRTTTSPQTSTQTSQTKAFDYSDPSSTSATTADPTTGSTPARILILTLSQDNPAHYIPLMNAIFAAQRLAVPLDILPLSPHSTSTFLQQAASTTGGLYIPCTTPTAHAGLLQTLMFGFLPDNSARSELILPGDEGAAGAGAGGGKGGGVDFRAACFCHRRIVDIGFVCSVCLSIFCDVLEGGECLTCGSGLKMAGFGRAPVVVARKKKKKRKLGADGVEGGGTPAPA